MQQKHARDASTNETHILCEKDWKSPERKVPCLSKKRRARRESCPSWLDFQHSHLLAMHRQSFHRSGQAHLFATRHNPRKRAMDLVPSTKPQVHEKQMNE